MYSCRNSFALVSGYDPVFCPDGPTSAQALLVAKAVTTLALAGWGAYVLGGRPKPQPRQTLSRRRSHKS